MEKVTTLGVDLAKTIFQVCGMTSHGKVVFNKKLRRNQFLKFVCQLPKCTVGLEACSSSHYWARELIKLGYDAKLMAPQFVKPYVKTNKNDAADAQAICEAVTRPSMRFVDVKTDMQQALLLLHRDRSGLIRDRTSLVNRLRASMAEFGVIAPQGINKLREWLVHDYGKFEDLLPIPMQHQVKRFSDRLRLIDNDIKTLEDEISLHSRDDKNYERLLKIPGVGTLTASALVATIGSASSFKNGRQLAAWLGLVPRQHSSGGKQQLFGISKRGDVYLRTLLIHGARAMVRHLNPRRQISHWINQMLRRTYKNKVIVAIANKIARIVWAVMHKEVDYDDACVAS